VEYVCISDFVLRLEMCLRCGIAVRPLKASRGTDRKKCDGRLV